MIPKKNIIDLNMHQGLNYMSLYACIFATGNIVMADGVGTYFEIHNTVNEILI